MSNTLFTSIPPPHYTYCCTAVPASNALRRIETYLHLSSQPDFAHLHPDCRFNEHGPTLEGRPLGGGLLLHQLGRIAKGLMGIRLIPREEGKPFQGDQAEVVTQEALNAAQGAEWDDPVVLGESEVVPDSFENAVRRKSPGRATEEAYDEQMRDQGEGEFAQGEPGKQNNIDEDEGAVEPPRPQRTDQQAKEARKEKKRKRDNEKRVVVEDAGVERRTKKMREDFKKRQKEEGKERRKSTRDADALAVEEDHMPRGQYNQINGVSSQPFEGAGDVRQTETLNNNAHKGDKKAKSDTRKRASQSRRDVVRRLSQSSLDQASLLDEIDASQSPARTKHQANDKKKRRKTDGFLET